MKKFLNYLGDNAVAIDVVKAEEKLRKKCPQLLRPDEKVELAFGDRGGAGRDSSYFTNKRFLVMDVKGITGKKVSYQSLPYHTIKAFAVETAGSIDLDVELQIWSEGITHVKVEYSKDSVDPFLLKRYLNYKVFYPADGGPSGIYSGGAEQKVGTRSTLGKVVDWLGDNAVQVDCRQVEQSLKGETWVLMPDETVEMAFKSGRDFTVLTNKRFLSVDVKGLTGKRVEFLSVLWKSIRAFGVETAGSFDCDGMLTLWTNIKDFSLYMITQDLRKSKVDFLSVQRFFSDKILGVDTKPFVAGTDYKQGMQEQGQNFLSFMGDDMRQIDATAANYQFHSAAPILQGSEWVEMAFKGRRDMILFTTKRLVSVDIKGWSGKKVAYTSIPWSTVQGWGVRSAGTLDKDTEMMLWTDIMHDPPPPPTDDGQEPPEPGMSYIEQDFNKDAVDLMAVHRYLSARCMGQEHTYLPPEIGVDPSMMQSGLPSGVGQVLDWLGSNNHQLDPAAINQHLHTTCVMLLPFETVCMAFAAGRDTLMFTTHRILIFDVQGFSGKRVEYQSIPYRTVRAFAVESAGSWDRDAELKVYCDNVWSLKKIKQDFRKGKADIIAIKAFLGAQVVGRVYGASGLNQQSLGNYTNSGPGGFLDWVGGNSHQIDSNMVEQQLKSSPPILQFDEKVDLAFKAGRDMYVYTSKRFIKVDVQGFTGKRVEYLSVPLKYCTCFAVQTAGTLDRDAEAYIYTAVPGLGKISQDLRVGKCDVFEVQTLLANKLCF